MHKQNSGNEAQTLTVADFFVQKRVGLQQVEEGQLTSTKLCGKIWMSRERSACENENYVY